MKESNDPPGGVFTYQGHRLWVESPDPNRISIEDIARSLAFQCRYLGHVKRFYSVAQHSILVSRYCDLADAAHGLLHDAAEAYLGDCIRPIKRLPVMEGYRQLESRLLRVILLRFGLTPILPESVKIADERILYSEYRDVRNQDGFVQSVESGEPYPEIIEEWDPQRSEREFLQRWMELSLPAPPVNSGIRGVR